MSDAESSEVPPTGLLKGLGFTLLMILAVAFSNDYRFSTRGHYENRLNPSQRIEFQSGSFFSGKARVVCFRTEHPSWVTQDDELVDYHRKGDVITFSGTAGSAAFTINNQSLVDSENVPWDRKFPSD